MSINERITDQITVASDSDSAEDIARRLIPLSEEEVLSLLIDPIAYRLRILAIGKEARGFAEFFDHGSHASASVNSASPSASASASATGQPQSSEGILAMLAVKFSLGNGISTTWGNATEEQHLVRIAMIEKSRNSFVAGANRTIARHKEAVELIRAAGASCLEEAVAVAVPI